MIELTTDTLPILAYPVEEAIKEFHLQDRLDVDKALNSCHSLLVNNRGAMIVDDLTFPKAVGILAFDEESIIFKEKFCQVILFYTLPAHRGNVRLGLELQKSIEEIAKRRGCNAVYGSEWVYRGARGMGSLWERAGYEKQEHVYVKLLRAA